MSFREVSLGRVDISQTMLEDGVILLESNIKLEDHPERLTEHLLYWAQHAPDRVFLARRDADGAWIELTYANMLERVKRIGQSLLNRGLSSERSVVILSENSLEHALLALAALHVGIPFAPISTAYSLISSDYAKLRDTFKIMRPGLVLVSDGNKYEKALQAVLSSNTEVIYVENAPQGLGAKVKLTKFSGLLETPATQAVQIAFDALMPDTPAKFLFTSGSTGSPKRVINTQRMLCANLQQIVQVFPFLLETLPVLVDWLPWNHTFGGNHNFGLTLACGGSLYIDDGKPTPKGLQTTLQNLREIAPTAYFNVPKGFEEMILGLRQDEALRKHFFSRLKLIFYAGAGLSQHVWDALEEISIQTTGERVVISTGLGCTESAPLALFPHWAGGWSGLLGVPVPGLELKLVPNGDKLEARYRGANITPGYWRQPEATSNIFDEDGFFRTGDALKLVNSSDPNQGLIFDGRIAEDFKLTSGTWVNVGMLRSTIITLGAPLVQDVVITGHDRNELGILIFPNWNIAREWTDNAAEPLEHPHLRKSIQDLLNKLEQRSTGSANRVTRAIFATDLPSIDLGEITDKGSLNQRAILKYRAALVEELYAGSSRVLTAKEFA